MNQCLQKTVGTNVTYFVYADEGLVAEADQAGTITTTYGFNPGSLWINNPLFQRTFTGGTNSIYFLTDHLGAPQRAMNASGMEAWGIVQEAFGRAETLSGSSVDSNLRFSSQYLDDESGLHWNTMRYYQTGVGRYSRRDPMANSLLSYGLPKASESEQEAFRGLFDRGAYQFVENMSPSLVDADGRSAVLVLIGLGIYLGYVADQYYETWWAPYNETMIGGPGAEAVGGNLSGVTVKDDCTIVVLYGHGRANATRQYMPGDIVPDAEVVPHIFHFLGQCQAGGFVGCVAKETNRLIPEKNRVYGLNTDLNIVLAAAGSLFSGNQKANFSYWRDLAKEGAERKAEEFCASESCCCEKVKIHWELTGSALNAFNWVIPSPPYRSKTIVCKDVAVPE